MEQFLSLPPRNENGPHRHCSDEGLAIQTESRELCDARLLRPLSRQTLIERGSPGCRHCVRSRIRKPRSRKTQAAVLLRRRAAYSSPDTEEATPDDKTIQKRSTRNRAHDWRPYSATHCGTVATARLPHSSKQRHLRGVAATLTPHANPPGGTCISALPQKRRELREHPMRTYTGIIVLQTPKGQAFFTRQFGPL